MEKQWARMQELWITLGYLVVFDSGPLHVLDTWGAMAHLPGFVWFRQHLLRHDLLINLANISCVA